MSRLKMANDPRYYIAAKEILPDSSRLDRLYALLGEAFGFYAKVEKPDGSKLLLNIRSLTKRLNISKSDIQQAAQSGTLIALVGEAIIMDPKK